MNTIARHLLGEFYGCDRSILDDPESIRGVLRDAAKVSGATVLGEVIQRFSPQGVSGVIVIAESHVSIHTWPECGYVAIDIYTCGGLDPTPGGLVIGRGVRAEQYRLQEILRGLPGELDLYPDGSKDARRITDMTPLRQLTFPP